MSKVVIGGIYEHYKKIRVKVTDVALHSETQEEFVVYIHLDDGKTWVRPKKMFLEKVIIKGKETPRFSLVSS
jgi:hypothetical protein